MIKDAEFMPVPPAILKLASIDALDKQFESFVYRNFNIVLLKSQTFKMVSLPDEQERDLRTILSEEVNNRIFQKVEYNR